MQKWEPVSYEKDATKGHWLSSPRERRGVLEAMLKSFEHVGMTVSDMDRAIDFYCGLLGLRLHLRKVGADGSNLAFLDAGGGMLEIVAPANGAARAVDVPAGTAGLRHLTFLFDSVEQTFARLEAAGVEIVERPRHAFHSEVLHKVAFLRDPDGILIELAERA
jgi:glyoxylase I family protein